MSGAGAVMHRSIRHQPRLPWCRSRTNPDVLVATDNPALRLTRLEPCHPDAIPSLPGDLADQSAGREKVIDWLKMLENRSAGHGEGPIAEYDFGWMWVELGLQEHRK